MIIPTDLEEWLRDAGRVLLGFSGGVDSSLLAVAGSAVLGADRFVAVLGSSASVAEDQKLEARRLADRFQVPLLEIGTDELADPRYRSNPINRCYFCKSTLWNTLGAIAAARGFTTLIDGTHVDDLGEHRPGALAGVEHRVRSPFVELGWTKDRIRSTARELGLPGWSAPSAPCLASRIQYGLEVTGPRLKQVELAEDYLRTLGVRGDLRVRHHGDRARVEVGSEMFSLVDRHWEAIRQRLELIGFGVVELDPRGYRRGGLLPVSR